MLLYKYLNYVISFKESLFLIASSLLLYSKLGPDKFQMMSLPHAHQLKAFYYPQVQKNVILSYIIQMRKGDVFL
ncbi:hypothetical protein ABB04_27395 [Bacillus tropicus]|nr:hypothetical protein [Bacillus tropicus]OTY49020.1 hypothetical protein BK748_28455 [Bacillus thuringiensis serovar graciosensis]